MSAIDGSSAPAHSYSLRSSAPANSSSSTCNISAIEGEGNGYYLLNDSATSNRVCSENEGAEAQVKGLRGRMRRKRFVGVRQRPSGRWVAEIKDTTQKIRMWLGTFETAEAAARAYDEAACLLRGSNTRTNFVTSVSKNSPLASRIRRLLSLRDDSNPAASKRSSNKGSPPFIHEQTPACCHPVGSCSFSTEESCVSTTTEQLDPPTHKINAPRNAFGHTGSHPDREPPAPSAPEISVRGDSDGIHSYSALDGSCALIDEDLPNYDVNFIDEPSANVKFGENGSCFNIDQYFSWPFDFGSDINMQLPAIYDDLITLPLASDGGGSSSVESEFRSEQALGFKRMKFERRISASLYAINGVQECLQNLSQPFAEAHECPPTTTAAAAAVLSSSYNSGVWDRTANSSFQESESEEHQSQADALWDLPPLCPLSCKS